VSCCL